MIDGNSVANPAKVTGGNNNDELEKKLILKIPAVEDTDAISTTLASSALNAVFSEGINRLELSTGIATLSMAPDAVDLTTVKNMTLEVNQADLNSDFSIEEMPYSLRAHIGNRPVLQLSMSLDGKQTEWNNPTSPIRVTIPYKPTAEELKDPDHIVIWYIDGAGQIVTVPSGKYDPVTGTITFSTTHFSTYAVAYVKKSFQDLSKAYARDMIEALASKGFYDWVEGTSFNPNRNITRAEFIYLLVTALDLHATFESNFADVKPEDFYYEAVGIARELGITTGVGSNKVGATTSITRQDMSTILVRALEIAGKNYRTGNTTELFEKFDDAAQITLYAKQSLATLVNAGIMTGYNRILDPNGNFTMQHAAVVIYKVFMK